MLLIVLLYAIPILAQEDRPPTPEMDATYVAPDSILVSWSEVEGADDYDLWVWWSSDPGWQSLGGELQTTTYLHEGLTAGLTYYYAIRARRNGQHGDLNSSYPQATIPHALTTPVLIAAYVEPNSVVLTWDTVVGADRYEVYVYYDGLEDWQLVSDDLTGTTHIHAGLTPGVTYYYTISSHGPDETVSAWITTDWPQVTIPDQQADTPSSTAQETVTPSPTAQEMIQTETPTSTIAPTMTLVPTNTATAAATDTPGSEGSQQQSPENTATVIATNTATIPRALTTPVLIAAYVEPNSVVLTWDTVAGADRYEVYVYYDGLEDWQLVSDDLTGTTHIHAGLTPGVTYYYTISSHGPDETVSAWITTDWPQVTIPDQQADTPSSTAQATVTPGSDGSQQQSPEKTATVIATNTATATATSTMIPATATPVVIPTATPTFTVVGSNNCEQAAPESVSGIGIKNAAYVSWGNPSGSNPCEVSGFTVGARAVGSQSWTTATVDPDQRSHLAAGLSLGGHEIFVRVEYERGASELPPTAYSFNVPADCTPTLTVAADVADGVSGSWTNAGGAQSGCESGGVFVEYKRSGRTAWDRSYRVPNAQEATKRFIYGQLDPGVQYEFRVVAIDVLGLNVAESTLAANDWQHANAHKSSKAAVTVKHDPSHTPATYAPRNFLLRHTAGVGFEVGWNAPSGAGDITIANYKIEYTPEGGSADSHTIAASEYANQNVRILGLSVGKKYKVRVGTEQVAGVTRTWHWSEYLDITILNKPYEVWFIDGTPNLNVDIGRVFMMVDTNLNDASAICKINGGRINCPPRTLVSLDVYHGGVYRVSAEATVSNGSGSIYKNNRGAETDGVTLNDLCGPQVSAWSWFSVGNGKAFIGWNQLEAAQTGLTGSALTGYEVVLGKEVDGECPQATPNCEPLPKVWESTIITKTLTSSSHTFEGLTNGQKYQARVYAISNTAGGTGTTPAVCLEGGEGIVGRGMIDTTYTFTPNASFTGKPGQVQYLQTTGVGSGSITVFWNPPSDQRSATYKYELRYRRKDQSSWTTETIYPNRYVSGACSLNYCEKTISGLTSGQMYVVEVRAFNVNGAGMFTYFLPLPVPN